jgi:trigger factor
MQIEVNEVEPCKLAVKYEAGALEILDKRAEIISAFKKAPVPGFRPGKASVDAIRMHYHQQIEDSLKRALAEDAYHNTLFEKKIRAHGAPKFTNLLMDGGKFVCEFEMFTKPEFELADFRAIEIPKPHEGKSSSEVAELMMQELRVRFGDAHPFEDSEFVQAGDNVILDYEGTIDGEPVPTLTAQGEMITIGKSQLASFDDNLLGMSVGETREFDFNVPEGGLPSLSGKTVHFKVNLVQGAKNVPCALDDEFAKKLGKKDFNELRDFVQGSAASRTQNAAKMAIHEAVAKKLITDNTVDVPNWMSLSEAQYLAHQSQLNWDTLSDPDKERFLEMAIQNVKLSLVLDKIRETEPEAQLTDQEVFEIIKQNLAGTKVNKPLDEVIQEMNRTGYLQILFSRIRDEHTMDFVSKTVKVIE